MEAKTMEGLPRRMGNRGNSCSRIAQIQDFLVFGSSPSGSACHGSLQHINPIYH